MPTPPAERLESIHETMLSWYDDNARDLPWRRPGTGAWGVLVSEVMLQQTPVRRVLPAYRAWLRRWPTPADLAADRPGEAVRMWDRLGYPRRALWLHAAATTIVDAHHGRIPDEVADLRALPGVGEYTASAVAVFAFGRRRPVLDTNVRRVLARLLDGRAAPPATTTVAERRLAEDVLPADPKAAARWSVAVMELGALVCTARSPDCASCPVAGRCRWRAAGRPAGPVARPGQRYAGTDRQARGAILAVLRAAADPVLATSLEGAWPEPEQRDRALASLLADGLVVTTGTDRFALP